MGFITRPGECPHGYLIPIKLVVCDKCIKSEQAKTRRLQTLAEQKRTRLANSKLWSPPELAGTLRLLPPTRSGRERKKKNPEQPEPMPDKRAPRARDGEEV